VSERPPALKPTEPASLVVAGLAAAAAAWLLISNFYKDIPPMIWPPVVIIAGIALFEVIVAVDLSARIHQRGRALAVWRRGSSAGPEPVDPLSTVRYAVLAKASSLSGAIFTGAYAGFLPWLLVESGRLSSAAADLPPTIGGLVASTGLMAAAVWLERACRVPEHPEDQDEKDTDAT
jgi:hypothetical protein